MYTITSKILEIFQNLLKVQKFTFSQNLTAKYFFSIPSIR